METKFQTSFIPKKPLTQTTSAVSPTTHHAPSILLILGIVIFSISVLAAGGAYGWRVLLIEGNKKLDQDLADIRNSFNMDLIIKMKTMDDKIDVAKGVLNNHVALSQIFGVISNLTAQNIRFTSMNLASASERGRGLTLKMSGHAPSYETLAFQSDKLGELEDLGVRDYVMNPVISNPVQNQNSTVNFEFSSSIVPERMLYKKPVKATSATATTTNTTNP